ncbi:hypothetical protein TTHERM_00557920 (macronuclear) [Tetrahymena thermophila SB210]|uniref:Uncharacterized protein n=1 Tax=Tetrahymena thermophila (strain SB210) TaxID=312017 RepID=I7M9M3_TETTS|nr:hypothetical protein TTHERM_00557920 [Tetrahymena thermophila SB210]EAS02111.2 hypothetical protein TTHERM_00557920 [Tetrahymena thermophila SB210]|eukprot:XP_001022356.2 hypothetical protein TTHERM_00557920 [Tetrahymena thermophila SB210]
MNAGRFFFKHATKGIQIQKSMQHKQSWSMSSTSFMKQALPAPTYSNYLENAFAKSEIMRKTALINMNTNRIFLENVHEMGCFIDQDDSEDNDDDQLSTIRKLGLLI